MSWAARAAAGFSPRDLLESLKRLESARPAEYREAMAAVAADWRARCEMQRTIREVKQRARELEAEYRARFMEEPSPGIQRWLEQLEADAVACLARAGALSRAADIPPRGERRDWIESLELRDDPDGSLGVAALFLHAVDLAHAGGEGAALCHLAEAELLAPLAESARQYLRSQGGGLRGGQARERDRKGRPRTVGAELLVQLQAEAVELRREKQRRFGSKRAAAEEIACRCARSEDPQRQRAGALSVDRLVRLLFPA